MTVNDKAVYLLIWFLAANQNNNNEQTKNQTTKQVNESRDKNGYF